MEALQVVVDGVVGLGGGLGRVHARAQGVLDGRATARVVTGGSPASWFREIIWLVRVESAKPMQIEEVTYPKPKT